MADNVRTGSEHRPKQSIFAAKFGSVTGYEEIFFDVAIINPDGILLHTTL